MTKDETKDSRKEALLLYLESTPPAQMLCDLSGGEKPLPADVQLAERLVSTHGMSLGVVNVLLQYVYIQNDGKITNNYVERIASHWKNKKITTAKEAMEVSLEQHSKYVKWKKGGQQPIKELENIKVVEARQTAIETAVYDSSMSDEQLGKFVRNMFVRK